MSGEYKFHVRNADNTDWVNILKDSQIEIDPDGVSAGQFAGSYLDEVLLELKDLAGGGAPGYAGTPIHIINTDDVTDSTDEAGSFSTRGGMAVALSMFVGGEFTAETTSEFDGIASFNSSINIATDITSVVNVTGDATGDLSGFVNVTGTGDLSGFVNVIATGDISGDTLAIAGLTSTDTLLVSSTVDGNLVPTLDATQFLGSPTNKWNTVYVGTISADVVNSTAFTGIFTGTLNGDVVGNVAGSVTGNLDGNLISSPTVTVTSNENSISPTTGAFVIEGGLGVALDTFMGGNLTVGGTLTASGLDLGLDSISENLVPAVTDTYTVGEVGAVWSNVYSTSFTGDLVGDLVSSTVNVTSSTGSTGPASGALVVVGGVGVQENLNVGGNLGVSGTFSAVSSSFNTMQVTGSIPSADKDTGALIVTSGGMGVEGNLNVGGDFDVVGAFTAGSFALSEVTGNLIGNVLSEDGLVTILENGTNGTDAIFIGDVTGDLDGDLVSATTTTVTSVVGSTSSITGALVVAGGMGIAENLYIGTNLNVTGTTDLTGQVSVLGTTNSTDKDTGALIVDGGVGIELDLYVGGTINAGTAFQGIFVGDFNGDFTGDVTGDLNGDLIKGTTVYLNNPTPATVLGTGALVISTGTPGPTGAGLSVEGNAFIGGALTASTVTAIWQEPLEAELLVSGYQYLVPAIDGDTNPITTLTLPALPLANDSITLKDLDGVWNTNPVTIDSNGQPIEGLVQEIILNVPNSYLELVFTDSQGWKII